jgi:mRNA interferase RelE/StbE
VLLRPARNYLERLPAAERKRILEALTRLADNPEGAPLKKRQGRPEWSLRVGATRILLIPQEEQRLLVVTRIGPRGDVYK